ncbi:hypothetical protein D3C87_1990140 [compost metagenome]
MTCLVQEMGIVFEQFRGHCQHPFEQCIKGGSFGDQPRNVLACRDPHLRFIVPLGSNQKLFHAGSEPWRSGGI